MHLKTLPQLTSWLAALLLCTSVLAQESRVKRPTNVRSTDVPPGTGQLETAPTLFPGGVDESGTKYLLNGQPAAGGKLVLTASNGFFDHGTCRAHGESELPKTGDDHLIKPNFAVLDQWKQTTGTLRWHIWLRNPGVVRFSVNMDVHEDSAGSRIRVAFAGQTRVVRTVASRATTPQPWNLSFTAAEPGEHTVALSASSIRNSETGVGALHTIDAFGPSISEARLLRARWRPAAVHGSYTSSSLKQSRIWVMTTQSVCNFSSYSPITTPFGYYGTSFTADRRSTGSFNFSMWAARAGGRVPPLEQMPHLLAAGSPDAEFSGFGHEGSGVKLRNWKPMPDLPTVCIQALRVESDDSYDTYSGYFWDHPTQHWKLYAVGRKWNGGRDKELLTPGSFCEIPGPPHVQRSGDRVREVRRMGWHLDHGGDWQRMDTFLCRSREPSNRFWRTTSQGEFAMGTGGIRYYRFQAPERVRDNHPLPDFLSPQATSQLFQLPAEIHKVRATRVSRTSATVEVKMNRAGPDAKAEVYYGTTDCLTFARRALHDTERRSEVSQSTQADDRSWTNSARINTLKDGINSATLSGLKSGTTYYFRVLVTNRNGRLWSFDTGSFETPK